MIRLVVGEDIPAVWKKAEPQVQRIIDRLDIGYSTDDIYAEILLNERQLWEMGGGEAFAVTDINAMPRYRTLDVSLVAGKGVDKWLPALNTAMEEFARVNGCKYVCGYGRRGWTRKLEEYGFRPFSYDVRKKA